MPTKEVHKLMGDKKTRPFGPLNIESHEGSGGNSKTDEP